MTQERWPSWIWAAAAPLFALLATANAAGYRYGVSDQAFYIPVVLRALNGQAFPRDAALIDAQGHLMLGDEILAGAVRLTGLDLPTLFLAGYLLSLALIWAGLVLIGNRLFQSPWSIVALGAAFSLRHRIARTSANSFEPYFHPRMLAFGLGVLALAALLRGRRWTTIALVAGCTAMHVTTGLWFALLIGTALIVLERKLRIGAAAGGLLACGVLWWAASSGPLSGSLVRMDDVWLRAVASKDSLFAQEWPLWAWLTNMGTLAVLWLAHTWRVRVGSARVEDRALVLGATVLVGVFLLTLPLVNARVALPVQLQISRVFWLVDFVATIYVIAALTDRGRAAGVSWRPPVLAAVVLTAAAARGTSVMLVEHPERALLQTQLVASPWQDAMRWLARQPSDIHVLADPGHAWKYGTSVRVAAERDVFLEEVKDSALAIYSHDVAARVVERTAELGSFDRLDAARAEALARQYDLDYMVSEQHLPLVVAYRNQRFSIYMLNRVSPPAAAVTARW